LEYYVKAIGWVCKQYTQIITQYTQPIRIQPSFYRTTLLFNDKSSEEQPTPKMHKNVFWIEVKKTIFPKVKGISI